MPRISELPLVTGPLDPDAIVIVVQDGITYQMLVSDLDVKGDPGDPGDPGRDFYNRRIQTVATSGTAVTCNWNDYDEIRITLTDNATLTFTGGNDGQGCTLKIKQDATGGRTVTLPANVRFNADVTAYTATTTANKSDRIGFINDAADGKYDFVSMIKGF